jgi:menaquinone-dependent protoporphyrinogen oxidase
MSPAVLVTYATRYGSTQEVAETLAATLRESGLEVDTQPIHKVRSLAGYSAIVLGAPLFMFHWHQAALRFLAQHRDALTERPIAIFALGPTHEPHDENEWQNSREQLNRELSQFPWLAPVALEMFGGKYDPAKLRFPLNLLAGKSPASDIRSWPAIHAWAALLKPILVV